jgi:hypothetical protein
VGLVYEKRADGDCEDECSGSVYREAASAGSDSYAPQRGSGE